MNISTSPIAYAPLGFRLWHGPLAPMSVAHRHDEIEIGVVACGGSVLLHGGQRVEIPAGQLTVFWGAVPHQVVEVRDGSYVYFLTLPLAWALTWNLPGKFVTALLHGQVMVDGEPARLAENIALLKQWMADLAGESAERREVVLLEVQARLRRLVLHRAAQFHSHIPAATGDKVARLAAHIARCYREPFSAAAIGLAVGLHPRSAMRLFRRACGTTLLEHVTFHRIAHAQRLLATTDAKVIDVACESGFPSPSRFYAAFGQVCGETPSAYRRHVRQDAGAGAQPRRAALRRHFLEPRRVSQKLVSTSGRKVSS